MKRIRKCECCGSPVTSYEEDGRIFIECSYCGKPADDIHVEDFYEIDEEDGE